MDETRAMKGEIRESMTRQVLAMSVEDLLEKENAICERVFDFANFKESKIILMYTPVAGQVPMSRIVEVAFDMEKIVLLPVVDPKTWKMRFYKVENSKKGLKPGPRGNLEPDPAASKEVPVESIELAFVPGLAFDERGGRIGTGTGCYDRLIPDLPVYARKVSLAYELQMMDSVPMESHDKHVDIIITEKRVIYKI